MAIRDAKGNLHSEINGRFIEKQEAAGRIDSGTLSDKDARFLWANEKSTSELRLALIIFSGKLPDTIPLPDEQLPRSIGANGRMPIFSCRTAVSLTLSRGQNCKTKRFLPEKGVEERSMKKTG